MYITSGNIPPKLVEKGEYINTNAGGEYPSFYGGYYYHILWCIANKMASKWIQSKL